MEFFIYVRESLNQFAWASFYAFRPAGYSLMLLFFVLGIILNFFTRAGGEEISSMLTRTVGSIMALAFFPHLIEGAKELVWTFEQVITSVTFEEAQVSMFSMQSINEGTKTMAYFLQLPLAIASKGIFFALNLIFSYLWVFLISSAPIFIPMIISPIFDKYAKIYFRIIVGILILRLPWAFLGKMMEGLTKFKFEGVEGTFASATLPLFFGVLSIGVTYFSLKSTASGLDGGGIIGKMGGLALAKATGGLSVMTGGSKTPDPQDFKQPKESTQEKVTPKIDSTTISNPKGENV